MRNSRTLLRTLLLSCALLAVLGAPDTRAAEPREAALEMIEAMRSLPKPPPDLARELERVFRSVEDDELRELVASELDENAFKQVLATLYSRYLSVEEMQEVTAFYRSPAGQKLAEAQPEVSVEAYEHFLGTMVDAVERKTEELLASDLDTSRVEILKQKSTVADIRNIGTAMMSWLIDQVSNEHAGPQPTVAGPVAWEVLNPKSQQLSAYHEISLEDLEELLVPLYIQEIPRTDGWGNPYEFALNQGLRAANILGVRSSGRDGTFEEGPYTPSSFSSEDYDPDIVWNDGFFIRWPSATERR